MNENNNSYEICFRAVRWELIVSVSLKRMTADGDVENQIVHLRTGASDLFPGDDILPEIDAANDKLLNRLERV